MRPKREHAVNRWGWRESRCNAVQELTAPNGKEGPTVPANEGYKYTDLDGDAERILRAFRSGLNRSAEDRHVNVGSVMAGLYSKTGLPAAEVVIAWRRGRSTASVGKPRTSGRPPVDGRSVSVSRNVL
jgi:hypothetical protein